MSARGCRTTRPKMFSAFLFLSKIYFQLFALLTAVVAEKTEHWKQKSMNVENTNPAVYYKCMICRMVDQTAMLAWPWVHHILTLTGSSDPAHGMPRKYLVNSAAQKSGKKCFFHLLVGIQDDSLMTCTRKFFPH